MSSIERASSVYALMNTFPASSPATVAPAPAALFSSPAPVQKGDYVMSDWAKLIIIWSLLQSMRVENDTDVPGAQNFTPSIPPSAGMTYGSSGQMVFGPSPAGQALAGSADVMASAMPGGMASIGGGAVTTGVGGGMAGAFVSIAV